MAGLAVQILRELAFAVVTESGCAERRPSRRLDFARASSCWGCAAAWKDGFPFYWLGGRRDGSVGRVVGDVELRGEWEMGDGGWWMVDA